jgi:hypothetical protein
MLLFNVGNALVADTYVNNIVAVATPEYPEIGDGLITVASDYVKIESSQFLNVDRVGIFYYHTDAGEVRNTSTTAGMYGIVIQEGSDVEWYHESNDYQGDEGSASYDWSSLPVPDKPPGV